MRDEKDCWAWALGPVIVAAALSACGGGGSSSSSSSSSSSDTSSGSSSGGSTVTAPSITTQPVSQTVSAGSSTSFSVVATGGGTLSYQWYKDANAISGATSAAYALSSVSSADAGSYYVTVTNSAGSATSSTATLTVSSSTSAACDSTYLSNVLSAVSTFEAALGSSLSASASYSSSSYTTAQLNVYKTNWSNLPPGAISFSRPGITLSQLSTASQISAFNALAKTALSTAGYADFQGVLAADDYLGYTKNANGYGADLYHVAVVGTPSTTGSWTLMFGGHHMAFNINFNQGCAYPTPHHIAVEPRTSFASNSHTSYNFYSSGTYQVLADKANAMVAVFSNLGSSLLSSAFLTGQTFSDILIGPVEANTGSYAKVTAKLSAVAASSNRGVLVSSLSSAQQAYVTAAIQQYLNDYDSATAARLLAEYQAAYSSTYVAWANASGSYNSAGPDVSANGTYMRIDGPRVWIEIAAQSGVVITNQTHYHMMFRDKSYDYYNQLGS
jgi:hypothetical protein